MFSLEKDAIKGATESLKAVLGDDLVAVVAFGSRVKCLRKAFLDRVYSPTDSIFYPYSTWHLRYSLPDAPSDAGRPCQGDVGRASYP